MEEETGTEMASDLLRVAQLSRGRAWYPDTIHELI